MHILSEAIVSNSEIIKNYKACREKAENVGKIFVLKNNQPDAVLFSITEYKRLAALIEYLEGLDDNGIAKIIESLPKEGVRKTPSIESYKNDIK